MGRPPLPVGTHGNIRVYRLGPQRFRARTQVRDHDGVIRDVERTGRSKAAAEALLKGAIAAAAIRDRGRASRIGEITGESTVRALGELWLAEINRSVKLGKRSPTTAAQYRYRFERHIRDGLGALRVRELTVSRLDRLVTHVQDRYGTAAAKTTRTVLSGMAGMAARFDAMDRNRVRDVGRIESSGSSARALSLEEAQELRHRIHAAQRAVEWDLLPVWMVDRLRTRRRTAKPNIWNVVFTSPMGGLRDPSNTQADLRTVFAAAGYGWVTSHVYRKTVATLMDTSGHTARQAADQLGHAKVSMTQDRYFGRKVARTGAAAVLEIFGPTAEP